MNMTRAVSYVSGRYTIFKFRRKNRALSVDLSLAIFLGIFGIFSIAPLVLTVSNAFKPVSEIFLFPPRFIRIYNPTLDNFFDLGVHIADSMVIVGRYVFNTFFITALGTGGAVLLGSMAAFPLAKYSFPGSKVMSKLVVYSLMFNATVTFLPNFYIMSLLGLIDTYFAVVLPVMAGTLGLYLMQTFITQIPMELIESAKIDGKSEYSIFFTIIMPLAKPAWITLIILSFNALWGTTAGNVIFTETLKPFAAMLAQVIQGGVARTGSAAAINLLMLVVPVTVFIVSQSKVVETMATSGIKG